MPGRLVFRAGPVTAACPNKRSRLRFNPVPLTMLPDRDVGQPRRTAVDIGQNHQPHKSEATILPEPQAYNRAIAARRARAARRGALFPFH
jgi:hypothetical protein